MLKGTEFPVVVGLGVASAPLITELSLTLAIKVMLVGVAAVIALPAPEAPTQNEPISLSSLAMRSRPALAPSWASSKAVARV